MDELKLRAGEKLEAIHIAAKTAAGTSKTRVQDVFSHTLEVVRKIRETCHDVWHHELIAEARARTALWAREAARRVREGAPPLSPVLLYEELKALLKDRVWRRSVALFVCGAVLGGGAGLALGLRAARRPPAGPHARALHAHGDCAVVLVDDAVAPGAGAGEVLVRVQAFSVCRRDRAALRGRAAALRALLGRPAVLVGRGFAGVVLDVGHGVEDLELGDEVWGCVSEWAGGAACELLTIRRSRVSKRPVALAADAAAALPWAGALALAALARLRCDPPRCEGKRVLVAGANSGEGCALVQLLAGAGARVAVLAAGRGARALQELGAQEAVEWAADSPLGGAWAAAARHAARAGPWDCAFVCSAAPAGPAPEPAALLRATAPAGSVLELRPSPLISDRLPGPFAALFAASFYTYRVLRWVCGRGWHTDWLEQPWVLRAGLEELARRVDEGQLAPVLDKVFLPQDFEEALAHACSDEAIGTTVIRFP